MNNSKKKGSKTKARFTKSFDRKYVYHGTRSSFDSIDPQHNRDSALDFGRGFYTTEDIDYARQYALLGSSQGIVREYVFDEDLAKRDLDIEVLDEADIRWLSRIIDCRIQPYYDPVHDITMGLSADSAIDMIIADYQRGPLKRKVDMEETIDLLEPYINSRQIVFHSNESIREPYLKHNSDYRVYVDARRRGEQLR